LKLFDPIVCFKKKKSPSSPRYIRIATVPLLVGESPACDTEGFAELPAGNVDVFGIGVGSEAVLFLLGAPGVDRVLLATVLADAPAFFRAVPVEFRLTVPALFATVNLY
jgi:hypothetical protein